MCCGYVQVTLQKLNNARKYEFVAGAIAGREFSTTEPFDLTVLLEP